MRIVLIGANGNVGKEVVLRLASASEVEVVPVCRTRGGSAFLRYRGVRCLHADISDPAVARKVFAGADVIANLALPTGDPARARIATRNLSDSVLEAAPDHARLVYFSTLAVHGGYAYAGARPIVSHYGREKKAAEAHFLSRARKLGRQGWAVRLGHVTGDLQPMSLGIRHALSESQRVAVEGMRPANLVHTVMIAELLHMLGRSEGPATGLYDLVNNPNWSWREAYTFEAEQIGLDGSTLSFLPTDTQPTRRRRRSITKLLIDMARNSPTINAFAMRLLEKCPPRVEERARAIYLRQLVSSSLRPDPNASATQPAFFWPELGLERVPGINLTRDLLLKWTMLDQANAWPPDLDAEINS
jgi:nucleoside-diphosphate-sugar epimerase